MYDSHKHSSIGKQDSSYNNKLIVDGYNMDEGKTEVRFS